MHGKSRTLRAWLAPFRIPRQCWTIAICILLSTCPIEAAIADGERDSAVAEFKSLFEEILRDPGNVELNLRYAALGVKLGDTEAAITALERLLVYAPASSNVRLQLGLLYLSIGADDMARSYLEGVVGAPDLSPGQRAEVADGLKRIAEETARGRITGFVLLGMQWQSNPATAPGSPVFLVSGVNQTVTGNVAKRRDTNWFAQGAAAYSYDLQNGAGDTVEADGAGYAASYRHVHQVNTAAMQLDLGPRLASEHVGVADGTFRFYGLLNYVQLGGAPYYRGYGGGLQVAQKMNDDGTQLLGNYEMQQLNYHPSANYPTARLLTGRLDHYSITGVQPLDENVSAFLSVIYNQQNTQVLFYSDKDYALAGGLTVGYRFAWAPTDQPWTTSVSVAGHFIRYDGADPSVSAKIRRTDQQSQVSITQFVPLTDSLGLTAQLFRDELSSNVPNYSYVNISALVGVEINF